MTNNIFYDNILKENNFIKDKIMIEQETPKKDYYSLEGDLNLEELPSLFKNVYLEF